MSINDPYSVASVASQASNIKSGTNPAYAKDDFLAFYPQFTGLVPDAVLTQFVSMANASVLQIRWHETWEMGMGLYIAHFLTLYLQTMSDGVSSTAAQVIGAAEARGLQTSQSVGDVSVSYDYGAMVADINGWADWKQTQFGIQYLRMARLLGKGGIYVQ